MSQFKPSSDLFIGAVELRRLRDFISKDGFSELFKQQSSGFGLIRNFNLDPNFTNGKVIVGGLDQTISVNPILAFDSNANFLVSKLVENISVSLGTHYVKAQYTTSSIEEGKVSIAADGTVTGVGTSFLTTLRQKPEFASKIRFVSSLNTQDYEVLEITDDTTLTLSGTNFSPESNLEFKIVGTFTPGTVPSESDKLIYLFDSVTITLEPDATVSDTKFLLAKVVNAAGLITIEDRRNQIWRDKGDYENHEMDDAVNPFIGVEAAKFDTVYNTKSSNVVELAWGLRSSNWSFSPTNREFVITNGQGGVIKRDAITTPFTNGDFNGWRLYYESGEYALVTASVIDTGAIKVSVDNLDTDKVSLTEEILLVPNVEEIAIKFTAPSGPNQVDQEYNFPINTPLAKIRVEVPSNSAFSYNVKYRYKNNNEYSSLKNIPTGSFYSESSFDENGVIDVNPANITVKNYTSPTGVNEDDGFIELTPSTDNYNQTINRVDKGDKFGVKLRELDNLNPLISLTPKNDEVNQYLQNVSQFIMSTDHIINLLTSEGKNGNEFLIFIKNPVDDSGGNFSFEIRQDYVNAGDQGTLIETLQSTDLKSGNLILQCILQVTDSSKTWIVRKFSSSSVSRDSGEIVMYSGTTTGKFDSSGLGISNRWIGWAICNGQNGTPDLKQKFLVGFDPSESAYNMGVTGGEAEVILTEQQMPKHSHSGTTSTNGSHNHVSNSFARTSQSVDNGGGAIVADSTTTNPTTSTNGSHNHTFQTNQVGGNQPHNNVPPFYSLAFVMKIS